MQWAVKAYHHAETYFNVSTISISLIWLLSTKVCLIADETRSISLFIYVWEFPSYKYRKVNGL